MKKKILLIEDEQMLVGLYKDKLKREGFKVISAIEAEGGIELAKKEKPDLILLDILLPKENGLFFLRELKKHPEISSIPVVAFSNYDDPETKREAIKLGAKEYLIKTNHTPQEVVERLKKYLGQKK